MEGYVVFSARGEFWREPDAASDPCVTEGGGALLGEGHPSAG